MTYAPPEITPATVSRGFRGALVVDVDGMVLGERPHLAEAIHTLCEHAVRFQKALVVTVASGSGKQYMAIDIHGVVSPAAAPAPRLHRTADGSTTFTSVHQPRTDTLGESSRDEITQRQWVDKYILDPNMATPGDGRLGPIANPAPQQPATQAPRKRRFFGR